MPTKIILQKNGKRRQKSSQEYTNLPRLCTSPKKFKDIWKSQSRSRELALFTLSFTKNLVSEKKVSVSVSETSFSISVGKFSLGKKFWFRKKIGFGKKKSRFRSKFLSRHSADNQRWRSIWWWSMRFWGFDNIDETHLASRMSLT